MTPSTRRLAAVWFADIVGYTRLSSQDEAAALALIDLFQQVARDDIEEHGGRLVHFIGDAVLADFQSTEAAVRAALDLQERFSAASRDRGIPSSLRIGVHVGDVNTTSTGDLFGDSVNTASRLTEGVARPGEVVVSQEVCRQLRPRAEFSFSSIGQRRLPGISTDVWVFRAQRRAEGARAEESETPALSEELAPDLEVVRALGEGSVARVFLAREPALGRLVAVKVLRPELANDEVARARFEREAKAEAGIRHPNVAGIYRVGRLSSGVPYIVMEYVEGRTFADLLQARGQLEVAEARRVLASLAHALAAAHRKGVVHRDLRPGNVMQESETGRVVLMDFGIAAILETGALGVARLTQPGERPGNPLYMSPEQARGESITQQSDVYGLGLVAYELLTGAGPYAGKSGMSLVTAQLTSTPPPLERLRPGVDPELATVVARCLKLEPGQRPTAAEVAEALVRSTSRGTDEEERASPDRKSGGLLGALGVREFGAELRRRRVYTLSAAYAASAFILLQVIQLVLPALPLRDSDAWYSGIVAVTLAGFPLAVLLGWIFDLTPHGIRRSPGSGRSRARRAVVPLLGLAVSIAAAYLGWRLYNR